MKTVDRRFVLTDFRLCNEDALNCLIERETGVPLARCTRSILDSVPELRVDSR